MANIAENPHIPTPHITAKAGDFAETVLMPGDPLRAKYIAETYLENPVLVNNVRGVNGYTGTYRGKRVSVMASGMGQPSIGIYSYELFAFYDVKNIIRVGSCGSFHPDLHARDIVIAMGACTNGNYASQYRLPGTFCPLASYDLVRRAADAGVKTIVGHYYPTAKNLLVKDFYATIGFVKTAEDEAGNCTFEFTGFEGYQPQCGVMEIKRV